MLEKLFTFSALRDGKGGGRVRLKMLHLTTPNKFFNQIKMNKNGGEEGVDKITNYQVWLR